MKKIINYIMIVVGSYLGLGWAADNPSKIKALRNDADSAIKQGYELAMIEFKAAQKEMETAQ